MNISVIIPTYNSARFIREALESVYSQTSPVAEIICVDDASSDDTVNIIKSEFSKVQIFVNDTNVGPSRTRNRGLQETKSEVVAFLDADDCWGADKTKIQGEYLNLNKDICMVGGHTIDFSATDEHDEPSIESEKYFNFYLSSFIIRKTVFDEIGYFNTAMRLSEDQDWFFRAREAGKQMTILDDVVLQRRLHDANSTRDLNFAQSGMMLAIKNSLERRRNIRKLDNLGAIKKADRG